MTPNLIRHHDRAVALQLGDRQPSGLQFSAIAAKTLANQIHSLAHESSPYTPGRVRRNRHDLPNNFEIL